MAPVRVILMSCGSYNPPTNMHLRMFEIARDHLHRLGSHVVVGGVISPVHDAYGKEDLASAKHRCAMLQLALQNNDWVRLSTWEMRQNGWTKTRISLQHHQNLLNSILSDTNDANGDYDIEDLDWIPEDIKNSSDTAPIQIKLLCGADLLESFGVPLLWKEEDIDAIVGQHGLVVVTREGSNPNKFIYDSDILSRHMHTIYIVTEWIPNEISSTRIRRALKRGESVRYLIQDPVIEYIYQNGIYDAKRPNSTITNTTTPTIKLELSSSNANDYLNAEPKSPYESAFLTPSPSDVTMGTPSPVEVIMIDVPDAVLRKNLQNSSSTSSSSSPSVAVATAAVASGFAESPPPDPVKFDARDADPRVSERFLGVIGALDNGNRLLASNAKTAYPGQAKQIIATESGESQILGEVGPDKDLSEVPGVASDRDSLGDRAEVPVEIKEDPAKPKSRASESNPEPKRVDDPLPEVPPRVADQEPTTPHRELGEEPEPKKELSFEIDGKYRKSLVNSKKSPRRLKDELRVYERKQDLELERERKVCSKSDDDLDKLKAGQLQRQLKTKRTKFQDAKVKRIPDVPLQGSLDSVIDEPRTMPPHRRSSRLTEELMSKKSKSFESIKRGHELSYYRDYSRLNELDFPDEFCSICCYTTGEAPPPGGVGFEDEIGSPNQETFYTLRSDWSSMDDPTECDICNSWNLQDSIETLKAAATVAPPVEGEVLCEICEICGEFDARDHRQIGSFDEEKFEIENCGVETQQQQQQQLKEFKEDIDIESILDSTRSLRSASIVRDKSRETCFVPKDEIARLTSGSKRVSRKGSSLRRRVEDSLQSAGVNQSDKRRYSSVDNLQYTKYFVKSSEKLVRSKGSKLMASAESIRTWRGGNRRSGRSLQRSVDDVRFPESSSADNLDALKESECETDKSGKLQARDNETVKMILTKHGIKIISEKETVL